MFFTIWLIKFVIAWYKDDPTPPVALAVGTNPRLNQRIDELCSRIVRGKAADNNPSVALHLDLRIASIILTSLGGVGVIAQAPATNLPSQVGWAFWGSVVVLFFGILSQVANEFQIAQRGVDSRTLAELCGSFETRLEDMVTDNDPNSAVAALFAEIRELFTKERYNRILPRMTAAMTREARLKANTLIGQNQGNWPPAQAQQGVVAPVPAAPPPAPPAPPAP